MPSRPTQSPAAPECAICGKPAAAQFRPFCSQRCANIDLGRWLNGSYAIPGEPASPAASDDDDETKQ